jgi:glycine cleavage system H protein
VLEANAVVSGEPGLLNSDPYGNGWLIKIRVTGDLDVLDHTQYAELAGGAS